MSFPTLLLQGIGYLLRLSSFLGAPTEYGAIRLDRFSPYFNHSAHYGLINVRALSPYRYLYPLDECSLNRIAYYFDFDYHPAIDPTGYAQPVIAYVQNWQQHPELGSLTAIEQPNGTLILRDTRSDAYLSQVKLEGLEQCVYQYCDQVHSLSSIMQHLHALFPEVDCSEKAVEQFLESLVANKLMVTDGKNYLSLALYLAPLHEKFQPREECQLSQELVTTK